MKKYFSGLVTGIVLTTLVGGLVVGASAISSKMTIEVDPINVMVNGKVFEPKDVNGDPVPVFAYNGTTMAPLRALAEAYGLEVGYDKENNMATVVDPGAKPVDTPAPDTTAKVADSDWSAEDEAYYKKLTDGWEFTLREEVPSIGYGGEIDTAIYDAKYKYGDFIFDWKALEKSDSFEKVVIKIGNTVNKTKQTNFGIQYENEHTIFLYNGWAHM